jgi:hypothetical protein
MSKHNDLFYEIVGEPEKNEQEYTMMLDFIDANPDYSEEELRELLKELVDIRDELDPEDSDLQKAIAAALLVSKSRNHWEDQERDERGRFGEGNGGGSSVDKPSSGGKKPEEKPQKKPKRPSYTAPETLNSERDAALTVLIAQDEIRRDIAENVDTVTALIREELGEEIDLWNVDAEVIARLQDDDGYLSSELETAMFNLAESIEAGNELGNAVGDDSGTFGTSYGSAEVNLMHTLDEAGVDLDVYGASYDNYDQGNLEDAIEMLNEGDGYDSSEFPLAGYEDLTPALTGEGTSGGSSGDSDFSSDPQFWGDFAVDAFRDGDMPMSEYNQTNTHLTPEMQDDVRAQVADLMTELQDEGLSGTDLEDALTERIPGIVDSIIEANPTSETFSPDDIFDNSAAVSTIDSYINENFAESERDMAWQELESNGFLQDIARGEGDELNESSLRDALDIARDGLMETDYFPETQAGGSDSSSDGVTGADVQALGDIFGTGTEGIQDTLDEMRANGEEVTTDSLIDRLQEQNAFSQDEDALNRARDYAAYGSSSDSSGGSSNPNIAIDALDSEVSAPPGYSGEETGLTMPLQYLEGALGSATDAELRDAANSMAYQLALNAAYAQQGQADPEAWDYNPDLRADRPPSLSDSLFLDGSRGTGHGDWSEAMSYAEQGDKDIREAMRLADRLLNQRTNQPESWIDFADQARQAIQQALEAARDLARNPNKKPPKKSFEDLRTKLAVMKAKQLLKDI